MSAEAYPLAWPSHKPRTPWQRRKTGQFQSGAKLITRTAAIKKLEAEVSRLGGANMLLSSDMILRADGLPHLGKGEPDDPGVCVYFSMKGQPYAMACDTYDKIAQNIAAVANHIEATRRIERYGVASASESLQVFAALPPPKSCWEILGVKPDATEADIRAAWRAQIGDQHPDRGGTHAGASEVNAARDEALRRSAGR